jgi:hypothetical protein
LFLYHADKATTLASGVIQCISSQTGKTLWKYRRDDAELSSPYCSADGNIVYFGFSPDRDAEYKERMEDESYASTVIALSAVTGDLLWETVLDDYGLFTPDDFLSGSEKIVCINHDDLYLINNQTGEILAEKEYEESQTILEFANDEEDLLLTRTVYNDIEIASIKLSDFSLNWEFDTGKGSLGNFKLTDSSLYFSVYDYNYGEARKVLEAKGIKDFSLGQELAYSRNLHSIKLDDGESNWTRTANGNKTIIINSLGTTFSFNHYRSKLEVQGSNSWNVQLNDGISNIYHRESASHDELYFVSDGALYLLKLESD